MTTAEVSDEPVHDTTAYQEFIARERARTAAEQARRRQCLSQHVTSEDLAAVELEQQASGEPDDAEEYDPWLNVLKTVEQRAGVKRVYDSDGRCELRVTSRYLLTSIVGVDPERVNGSTAGIRLGRLMRKLNWTGPKPMRFGKHERTRGYCKFEEVTK